MILPRRRTMWPNELKHDDVEGWYQMAMKFQMSKSPSWSAISTNDAERDTAIMICENNKYKLEL